MANTSNKYILKEIFARLKRYKLLIFLTLVFAIISVAGTLTIPILFGGIIDLLTAPNAVEFNAIFTSFLIIAGIIVATIISQWLMNVINNKITFNVVKDIRDDVFNKIHKLPLKYIDGHSSGEIVEKNISNVDQFADGLLTGFTQLFSGVLTIIATLGIMFAINWIIALVVFVVTPLSLFVAKFIASKTYKLFRKTAEIREEQTAFISEMVGNLKTVKAFAHEEQNLEQFDAINEDLSKASLKSIFYSSLTNPATRFVNAVVYALVALTGAIMLIRGTSLPFTFTVGMLTSLLSYANQYTKPFNEISGVITELQNALACAGKVFELLREDEMPNDSDSAIPLKNAQGNVAFDAVDFSYDKSKELIKQFSLSIKKGQHVAIVGPTGCGKTTLINLLMRFYEIDSGHIKVDDIDVKDITKKSLRQSYGMVLQETWLKNASVRDNIKVAKQGASDSEVIKAAKAAHAHNFIMQLKDGYDTIISEDGENLSQGQRQLLCIARVMLTLPPMLILDEATSSIDTRTEQKIQDAFKSLMKGRTSFVVAHRLSTIKSADLILVMNGGKIIEQGDHKTLLKQNGFYARLYKSQFES